MAVYLSVYLSVFSCLSVQMVGCPSFKTFKIFTLGSHHVDRYAEAHGQQTRSLPHHCSSPSLPACLPSAPSCLPSSRAVLSRLALATPSSEHRRATPHRGKSLLHFIVAKHRPPWFCRWYMITRTAPLCPLLAAASTNWSHASVNLKVQWILSFWIPC